MIGNNCFMSVATIGGHLFSRNPKKMNHVNIYTNDISSLVMTMGNNVSISESVFLRIKVSDLRKYHML